MLGDEPHPGAKLRIPDDLSVEHVNNLLAARRTIRLQRILLGVDYLDVESRESSSASEQTLALCQSVGADEYMGGGTAMQAYLDTELLCRNGIEVLVQDWQLMVNATRRLVARPSAVALSAMGCSSP